MLNWNDSVICGHKSRVKWVIEFFLVEFLKIRSSREVWTARVGGSVTERHEDRVSRRATRRPLATPSAGRRDGPPNLLAGRALATTPP